MLPTLPKTEHSPRAVPLISVGYSSAVYMYIMEKLADAPNFPENHQPSKFHVSQIVPCPNLGVPYL